MNDFETDILAAIDAPDPSDPRYWIAEFSSMGDALRRDWATRLSEESLPPTTLDIVFRWLSGQLGVSLGSVRAEFQQRLREINEDDPETHGEWSRWFLTQLPVNFAQEGTFWVFDDESTVFNPLSLEEAAVAIGETRGKNLTRRGDYQAVAGLAYSLRATQTRSLAIDFPMGVAVQQRFYRLTAGGLVVENLKLEHYARFKIDAKPRRKKGLFTEFIKRIADEDQQRLLRQHFAAVLFGIQWKMQKCVLWYGPAATGKSTLMAILESMVPRELISAVPPADWEKEYHTAAMAGKVLNVVGEIEDKSALGAAFKNVTGGGRINARHPTQQPFSFVSKAAQVFCSNYLPPSSDKSDAFWRRWSVVEFTNVIAPEDRDTDLAAKILKDELGCVLAFALQGAEEIADASEDDRWRFLTTERQDSIKAQWVLEINSVAAFLEDDDVVILGEQYTTGKTLLFQTYSQWCRDNNQRPLGRNKFNREMLVNSGAERKIEIGSRQENRTKLWIGVGLLDNHQREVF